MPFCRSAWATGEANITEPGCKCRPELQRTIWAPTSSPMHPTGGDKPRDEGKAASASIFRPSCKPRTAFNRSLPCRTGPSKRKTRKKAYLTRLQQSTVAHLPGSSGLVYERCTEARQKLRRQLVCQQRPTQALHAASP